MKEISKEERYAVEKFERKKARKDHEALMEELVPKPTGR
jgi:hypothetical protein